MKRAGRYGLCVLAVVSLVLGVACGAPANTWTVANYAQHQELDFKHYPVSTAVTNYVTGLAAEHPHLVKHEVVGYSVHGKPISALTVTNTLTGSPEAKPALLIIAQQHAREPIGSQVALYWLVDLLAAYGRDEIITHLLDTRTIYVLPQLNPDGNDVFLNSDNRLRTNLRQSDVDNDGQYDEDPRDGLGIHSFEKWLVHLNSRWLQAGEPFRPGWNARDYNARFRNGLFARFQGYVDGAGNPIKQHDNDRDGKVNEDGYHGVDLNRNWDFYWLEASTDRLAETYKGPQPWSEPETRAARDFILLRDNIVAAVDLHSGVELLLYPWSITDEPPVDIGLLQTVSRTGSALTQVPHTQGGVGLYRAYGGAKDWLYSLGVLAITAEVFEADDVFSFYKVGPNIYQAFRSLAYRFNPPPAKIWEAGERWGAFLTYMLAILPGHSVSKLAVSPEYVELAIINTGFLTVPYTAAYTTRESDIVALAMANGPEGVTLRVPVKDGEVAAVTVELGSPLAVAERPVPPVTFEINRASGSVKLSAGAEYAGKPPATLFPYGFAAPRYPWGVGEWFIKQR